MTVDGGVPQGRPSFVEREQPEGAVDPARAQEQEILGALSDIKLKMESAEEEQLNFKRVLETIQSRLRRMDSEQSRRDDVIKVCPDSSKLLDTSVQSRRSLLHVGDKKVRQVTNFQASSERASPLDEPGAEIDGFTHDGIEKLLNGGVSPKKKPVCRVAYKGSGEKLAEFIQQLPPDMTFEIDLPTSGSVSEEEDPLAEEGRLDVPAEKGDLTVEEGRHDVSATGDLDKDTVREKDVEEAENRDEDRSDPDSSDEEQSESDKDVGRDADQPKSAKNDEPGKDEAEVDDHDVNAPGVESSSSATSDHEDHEPHEGRDDEASNRDDQAEDENDWDSNEWADWDAFYYDSQ